MNSWKPTMCITALALLAFVCAVAFGASSDDGGATSRAMLVDASGDNTATIPDFDGDGTIGFGDFVILAGAFGSRQGDEKYVDTYDLNGDGEIGFSDFVIFAQNFGKEAPSPVAAIPDANLRAAIETALGKDEGTPITQVEMGTMGSLTAIGKGISDLTGLEYATSLTELVLLSNNFADISALADLNSLETLILRANSVVNITALAGLTKLTNLDLGQVGVSDISALAGLTGLTELNLEFNDIADISALRSLTRLTDLNLQGNDIKDISALVGLTELSKLNLRANDIADISALEGLVKLSDLNLAGNNVADISALTGLVKLRNLNLAGNRVTDVSPLVANSGFGNGDRVDVTRNPLNTESIRTQIPALKERGIRIFFDENIVYSTAQIYNDNVFVLPVKEHLPTGALPLRDYAVRFYEYFSDGFEFLLFMANLTTEQLDDAVKVADYYSGVGNDIKGIGLSAFFDDTWESAGKLQGVIFSSSAAYNTTSKHTRLISGNTLHELMHRWGNYIVPPYPHFGDTSNNGALGGFDIDTLVDHGGGVYSAGFGPFYSGFSPLELYLSGFVPAKEVPDLLVVVDAKWSQDGRFTASRIKTLTIEEIITEHGPRVPNHLNSQKHFRAAVVLLVSEDYPATRWILETLSNDVTLFSHAGEDQFERFNFYEATGGRGTITMDGLSQFKRNAGAKITVPNSFGTPPPPVVDLFE